MVELASTIWADGPSGAPVQPPKALIRQWGTYIESLVYLSFTSGTVYSTKAALFADLVPAANRPGLVIGDPVPGNDGLYQKVGATTVGSWTQLTDFVPGAQIVHGVNVGAGTPNAIAANTNVGLSASGSQIVNLDIISANTASPVTVRFNGGSVLTIKTASGGDVVIGGLKPGPALGVIVGSTFRLLSDQSSAAIQAAAEAALSALATQYLGAKSADPSLDNSGNMLVDGASYWNTTSKVLRVWDAGSAVWFSASFRYRGAWSGATTYIASDVVQSGGSLWLALRTNTNVAPVAGADWQLFMAGSSVADGAITKPKLDPTIAAALRDGFELFVFNESGTAVPTGGGPLTRYAQIAMTLTRVAAELIDAASTDRLDFTISKNGAVVGTFTVLGSASLLATAAIPIAVGDKLRVDVTYVFGTPSKFWMRIDGATA